jgi:hypothetical protein
MRGTLVGVEEGSVLLRVPVGERRAGFHRSSLDQTIRIPASEIVTTEVRQLDVVETSLLIAGAAAGSAFLISNIIDEYQEREITEPVGPVEGRVPLRLFGLPIGF